MAKLGRIKTTYPGVYYIEGPPIGPKGQKDKIYYIIYRKDGKQIEEKVQKFGYVGDIQSLDNKMAGPILTLPQVFNQLVAKIVKSFYFSPRKNSIVNSGFIH